MNRKIMVPVSLAVCLLIATLPIYVRAEQTTLFNMIVDMLLQKPSHAQAEHIKILNPVSKPTLWGRWEVEFETTGKGDLGIEAYGATFFRKDVEYVQLYCGGRKIDVEEHFSGKGMEEPFTEGADNGKIVARDWDCDGKARLVLRILATGHHYLEFSFLGETAYAENFADCTGTDLSPCACCDVNNMWVKITAPSGGGSREYNLTYQSSSGACSSTPFYINETWTRSIGYTFCTTEGQYTAVENASSAGGDASCAVYSNDTSTSFNLYTVGWDDTENWCNCTMGTAKPHWNISGEADASTCCGDEVASEFNRTRAADSASMHNGYASNSADDACCSASTDCVNNSVCYDTGSVSTDVDGNGDTDYCNSGTWYDCLANAQCASGYVCNASYDCMPGDILNGGHGTTCDASNNCFLVKNSAGVVKARFDKFGYVDVKGSWSPSQSSLSPPAGSFMVRNVTAVVLYIDSSGNLATRGYFYRGPNPAPSGNNYFIVRNSTGVVGYINGAMGNMNFTGTLHYNSDF